MSRREKSKLEESMFELSWYRRDVRKLIRDIVFGFLDRNLGGLVKVRLGMLIKYFFWL